MISYHFQRGENYNPPELIPDPEQQQASLQAGDESLSDQLLKTLGVKLPPHLANALSPGNKQE